MSEGIQLFDMIINSDGMTKIILGVLGFFSLFTWAIIFDKMSKFREVTVKHRQFLKIFWSGQILEDIYKKTKNAHKYPMAQVFNGAMQEWEGANVLEIVQSGNTDKKNSLKDRMYDIMSVKINKSLEKYKTGLGFLLIVASTSTLFGLFGTVWGIMKSFSDVVAAQTASLVVLAPGISASLITTVFGLISALPALMAYYIYSGKVVNLEVDLENFELELMSILSKELEQ